MSIDARAEDITPRLGCPWCNDTGCLVCAGPRAAQVKEIRINMHCGPDDVDAVLAKVRESGCVNAGMVLFVTDRGRPGRAPKAPTVRQGEELERTFSRDPEPVQIQDSPELAALRVQLAEWSQHRTPLGLEKQAEIQKEITRIEELQRSVAKLYSMQPPPRVLCILQNTWVKDPARVQAMIDRHGRAAIIPRLLFMGSVTGRRLTEFFGEYLCGKVTWEECSPVLTDKASAPNLKPDLGHMAAMLEELRPQYVFTFGAKAREGWEALHPDDKQGITHYHGNHPAARQNHNEGWQVMRLALRSEFGNQPTPTHAEPAPVCEQD